MPSFSVDFLTLSYYNSILEVQEIFGKLPISRREYFDMNDVFSILLVEDDAGECEDIKNYINTLDQVRLTEITNNSDDAIASVKRDLPDAVILDLELHHGGGDGLLFLSDLKQLELQRTPYILITTNNPSKIVHKAAREAGADFIFAKFQSDYSARRVIGHLLQIQKLTSHHILSEQSASSEPPDQKERRILERIRHKLNLVGVSPKVVGYKYLTDSILLTMRQTDVNLYRILGEKYRKSDASIQRAMQNAINRAWRMSDPDDLLMYYTARISSERGCPTIMEFIFYYATKLRDDFLP